MGRAEHTARRRTVASFSLLELVMVLAIVAVMAAVAIPRMSSSTVRYRAEVAAHRLAADLAWAQRHAMAKSASQEVYFDLLSDAYWLYGIESLNRDYGDTWVKLGEAPYHARIVSAFGKTVAHSGTSLFFDGYGQPDVSGDVIIAAGDEQRTVTVDADTGKATVQ
jgi:type II secretory pathway pseudopilin PulG